MKSRTAPTLARAYTLGGTLLMSEVLPANATGDVIAARVEERCGLSRKKQLVHPLDSKDPGSLAFVVTVVSEPDLGPLDRAHGFDYPDNPVVGTWTRDTAETTVRISRNFITGRLDYSEPISDVVRLHGFLGPEGFEGSPFFAWSASLRLCRLPTNRDVRRICPCYGACPETIPKPIGRVRLWASGPDSLQVECHADGVADSPQNSGHCSLSRRSMDDWDPADQTEGEDRRALKDSEWEELRQAGNDHYAVCKMLLSDVLGSAKDSGEAPFDAKMWNYLAHGELPSAPTGRKEKMQHDIEVKNLKRAKDASRPGGSMENQCYYIYKYAKNRDSLDALVSLHRCIEALRGFGRQGTARAEQELAELLDEKLARTSGPALLKLVAEEEETLGRNTFKLNARPRLYEEQQRFVALLTRPGPQLVYYTTPPSSGKTFSVAIAALVVQKTRLRRALSYVLYTVYNENVRIDVCKTLLGCQLPFLICRGGNFSVSPTCFHKNARAVDTASIACVQQRLAKVARAVDVMPVAVVADLESAQKLLHAMSPSDRADVVTIVDEPVVSNSHIGRQYADLMRASTPRVVLMSASIPAGGLKNYTEHYTAAHGGSVSYIEKTSVKSVPLSLYLGGELMMPHELGAGVADIEADPFLQRFYSVHALARIGLPERRNPKQLLTQEGILELCMERLRENCATTLTPPVVEPPEGLAKMLTSGSNGYQGITLVLVRDPREVDEPVGELLSESSYSLEKFLKKRDASEWPCVVNSKAHTARYHAKGERIPPFRLKMCPPLSDVVVQTSNATLVENALSGVFVLTDQRLDRMLRYNLTNLANGCYESMIVADESIVFGTNLPIDNIVCRLGKRLPSFAWKQLIGRAGRTGKSYRASVRVYSLEDVESIFETGAGCAIDEAFRRD